MTGSAYGLFLAVGLGLLSWLLAVSSRSVAQPLMRDIENHDTEESNK